MKQNFHILIIICFLLLSCKKNETVEKNKAVENKFIIEKKLVSEKEIYEVINVVLGSINYDELSDSNFVTEDVFMKYNFKENDLRVSIMAGEKAFGKMTH